jgi:LacI family transcriptional regulator
MPRKLTIQDIARLAGVSRSTVSRVLNKKPDVDDITRERVLRVIAEHGFIPDQAATRLAGGRSKIIGVIAPSVSWPLIPTTVQGVLVPVGHWPTIPEIMRGITDALGKTPYELLLYSIDQQRDHREIIQRILATQLLSGLLVVLPGQASPYLLTLHEQGLPVVIIDDQGNPESIPWVGINNYQGAYRAVHHLIRLGHRRIGHIRGLYACSEERYQGYCDALREANIPLDTALIEQGDFTVSSGQGCANRLLALPEPPSAIFAGNDQMAVGVLAAAEVRGLQVPDELAVVGFDDIPFSAHLRPSLTTVRQPLVEMGQKAVELLLSLIHHEARPLDPRLAQFTPSAPQPERSTRIYLETELIIRESCGATVVRLAPSDALHNER